MRFYDITFFVDEGNRFKVDIEDVKTPKGDSYAYCLQIRPSTTQRYSGNRVTFYFDTKAELDNFKSAIDIAFLTLLKPPSGD